MRANQVGFYVFLSLALGLWLAPKATAQPVGEVESIGFNNVYRPGCWTPMVVKIKPNAAPSGAYQIQVKQRDRDNDVAVFTREISLTGSAQGGGREQRFWMYFIPQPVNRGLPDRLSATLKDFQDLIEVYLCDEDGKQITQLPITAGPDSVDPPAGALESSRGTRLVLAVTDGNSRPAWDEYRAGLDSSRRLVGVMENVLIMPVRPRELPENPLGYEAVDAVVWFDADPASLDADGGLRRRALDSWIRDGGHLVISQNPNWQPTLAFGDDLLPVRLSGVEVHDQPEPLRTLATSGRRPLKNPQPWEDLRGPFRLASATPRDDALVELWIDQDEPDSTTAPSSPRRPYLVRRGVGCGAVTWIAQDLGDPALTLATKQGWANIWTRILDLRDRPVAGEAITKTDEDEYPSSAGVDLGDWLNTRLESKARVGLYISLAVVFFVLYWLLAGPGVFLFLAGRRQTQLSWFLFAAVALAATLLTVGVVRLVLRGPPELNHLSIVRGTRGEDGVVRSRFGLYIPRDGNQTIELTRPPAEGAVTAVAALPVHPAHLRGDLETAGKLSYGVPVRELTSSEPASLTVPYRSTLKQFQAWWSGRLDGRIEGIAQIDRNNLSGSLTNGTGKDLQNVYIAYKRVVGSPEDFMMYLPEWKAGVTLDLAREQQTLTVNDVVGTADQVPGKNRRLWGRIHEEWYAFWLDDLRKLVQMGEGFWDDPDNRPQRALPMLTFFSRLPPAAANAGRLQARIELLRRGARHLDLSPALAAGSVVVIAEAFDQPLPLPLTVQGDEVPGNGRVLYQFVLPTVRKAMDVE